MRSAFYSWFFTLKKHCKVRWHFDNSKDNDVASYVVFLFVLNLLCLMWGIVAVLLNFQVNFCYTLRKNEGNYCECIQKHCFYKYLFVVISYIYFSSSLLMNSRSGISFTFLNALEKIFPDVNPLSSASAAVVYFLILLYLQRNTLTRNTYFGKNYRFRRTKPYYKMD